LEQAKINDVFWHYIQNFMGSYKNSQYGFNLLTSLYIYKTRKALKHSGKVYLHTGETTILNGFQTVFWVVAPCNLLVVSE
jgi:hypothetical protein